MQDDHVYGHNRACTRLLRKLQTNSLDESERRQSVLNKCLWEMGMECITDRDGC